MEVEVLLQEGNQLEMQCRYQHQSVDSPTTRTSKSYLCGGAVGIQLRLSILNNNNIIIKIRFLKMMRNDDLIYKCNFLSKKFSLDVTFSACDKWYFVFQYSKDALAQLTQSLEFDVAIQLEVAITISPFASLYEDTKLTDFELRAEDGSISVHSLVLAVVSPYFKTLLTGNWKESSERHVTVTGTKKTLEQFKAYIYLNKLPDTDIQKFMLLGSYYMMPELVNKCSAKLLSTLNAKNFVDRLEFVLKNKLTDLLQAMLRMVKSDMVSIEEVGLDDYVPGDEQ